jgi:hypothetical protein
MRKGQELRRGGRNGEREGTTGGDRRSIHVAEPRKVKRKMTKGKATDPMQLAQEADAS